MAIKLEKVVEKFYQGLEEGKFLGRKCPVLRRGRISSGLCLQYMW